ncbi:MAG TPA: coenzyme F420-0:L-glutamate ligase [Candidatus Saccharimonadales bacterium]|nr:coenzyme F420-0:L-glutamate ligase [Candidatus Saccharimonadales bacterium]
MQDEIRIIPIQHIPEVKQGDDLVNLISKALDHQQIHLEDHDILVVTQKIVSKSEGQVIDLDTITPSQVALEIAEENGKDPRYIELVLQETKRVVRMEHGIIISETHHGFICANAGVDASNVGRKSAAALLPKDPDTSAKQLRETLEKKIGIKLGIIISDTWGRPWREGQVNFAIGTSGLDVLVDYKGEKDSQGFTLKASLIAIADEIASAAELAMNKIDNIPVALVRGYKFNYSHNGSKQLLRDAKKDMFR